ncbi:hypothetical protein CEXT_27001 [Caerostris extrusa]|uniref:Uncharacterized protein n=1 Tax=Caerostris extrusa TaxID=172846 RepID=A0AAV4XCU7_CAEEX|nr:hypothetical protein CEXT_27001 [Caerostris extrusa]
MNHYHHPNFNPLNSNGELKSTQRGMGSSIIHLAIIHNNSRPIFLRARRNLLRRCIEGEVAEQKKSRNGVSSPERMQAQDCFVDTRQTRVSWAEIIS